MRENIIDIFGEIIWFLAFIAPLISIVVIWRSFEINKFFRIVIGLIIGLFISLLCYFISIEIIFRNGMGPI
jgi:hypothetical protein